MDKFLVLLAMDEKNKENDNRYLKGIVNILKK